MGWPRQRVFTLTKNKTNQAADGHKQTRRDIMNITIYGVKGNETDYKRTFTVKEAHTDGSYSFTSGHRFDAGDTKKGGQLVSQTARLMARYAYAEQVSN